MLSDGSPTMKGRKITLRTVLALNDNELKSLINDTHQHYEVRKAAANLLVAKQTEDRAPGEQETFEDAYKRETGG